MKVYLIRALVLLVFAVAMACSGSQPEPPQQPTEPAQFQVTPMPTVGPKDLTPDALSVIKSRGELRVGMQVGYAPFEMLSATGALVGFDVECAQALAADLNVELRLARLSWPEMIPMLLDGRIDVIMSGMTVTPERNLHVMFSNPVVETGRMFATHISSWERIKKPKDLNVPGIFVVYPPGGLGDLKLKKTLPKVSSREFPDRKSAVNEVIERRAQAIIDEEFAIRMLCASNLNLIVSRFEPLTSEVMAWAVRPTDSHWLNYLNMFLVRAQGAGTLDRLKTKWLQDYFNDLRGPAFH